MPRQAAAADRVQSAAAEIRERNGTPPGPDQPGRVKCPFAVICDTREQSPYAFARIPDDAGTVEIEEDPYEFKGLRANAAQGNAILDVTTVRIGLGQGDYAVFGLPGMVIERKSLADLYGSVARRENFVRRLEMMQELKRVAFVVVEAEIEEVASSPPPFSSLHPKSLVRTVQAWELRYPLVHWKFLKDRQWAESYSFRLLERWYLDHKAEMIQGVHRDPKSGKVVYSTVPGVEADA